MNYESLAQSCGISRSLIQHYFPDRDELILTAMRFVRAKYQKLCVDAIATQSTAKGQLKAYLEAACSWPKVYPQDAKIWLLFYYNCSINKKYRKVNTELVAQGHERIIEMLEGATKGKALPMKISLSMRAKIIQGAILNYFLSTLTEEQSKEFNQELLGAVLASAYHIARLE